MQGAWTGWPLEVPSNPKYSVMMTLMMIIQYQTVLFSECRHARCCLSPHSPSKFRTPMANLVEENICMLTPVCMVNPAEHSELSLPPALANSFLPLPAPENSRHNNEDDLKIVRFESSCFWDLLMLAGNFLSFFPHLHRQEIYIKSIRQQLITSLLHL